MIERTTLAYLAVQACYDSKTMAIEARVTNRQRTVGPRPRVWLHIEVAGQVRKCELPAVGLVLGADPACDLPIEDSAVSRHHASFTPVGDGVRVVDLGSTNGTFVNGVKVRDAILALGATVRVGATHVTFWPVDSAVSIPPSEARAFGQLRGGSHSMRVVYALLERAASRSVPVLLLGETGTGKELAARAIHEASSRASAPFVVVDCGASSESLIESELFGHVRGAFTGAHSNHQGAFARAAGGTLFLDELGNLPLALQPKLLRLLEAGEVTPLGGRKAERYDVRVVAATHVDLWEASELGTFRLDLLYRLAVVEIHLPPLRERKEDLGELVSMFLAANGASEHLGTGSGLARLARYDWPGNVRELRNVIARAVTLGEQGASFEDLPILLRHQAAKVTGSSLSDASIPYHDAKKLLLEQFESSYLKDLWSRAAGNVSEAARLAGLERKYLYTLLSKHGLHVPAERDT
jgi:DNA-binding NtrC family response regulator